MLPNIHMGAKWDILLLKCLNFDAEAVYNKMTK